jgi:cation-transporting ATPase I
MIDEVLPKGGDPDGADEADLHARALGLLDPADPSRERRRHGWRIAPKKAGALTLFHRDRVVADVRLVPELDPYAEALVAAAAGVGEVYVAGVSSRLDRRLKVAGAVPGGSRLTAALRDLERDGRGVVLVAGHGRGALTAADIGIAVVSQQGPVASARRGAGHVVCGPGLADVVQLLSAVPAAREAAATGARIAGYEAVAATVLGLAGRGAQGSRNATLAAHMAALAGIAAGVWHADPVVRMRPPRPVDRNPWHAIPVREVLARLRSSPRGLPEEEAADRQPDQTGTEPDAPGLGRAVAEDLVNPLTPALAAGAGLAAAVGSTLDAALIGGVVAVNSVVGGVQRLGADRAVRRLARHASTPVRLLRDGEPVTVPAEEVVPGDVVELRSGDAVPADCRVVEAVGLEMDEANLTGESLPVVKTAQPSAARVPADRVSMVYEGTAVAAGHGLATVVATGPDTEARRAEHLAHPPRPGAVHDRLGQLTRQALPLSAGAGVLLLATNLLRGQSTSQALSPAVSLAVAAVPEGLPSVATVAQLAAARRLSRRGVLVRNPGTLESLGRVQALCFDKTGTLTEGRLAVTDVVPLDGHAPDEVLRLAAGVEAASEHPLAAAIVAAASERGITVEPGDDLRAIPGVGVEAGVDGRRLFVGRPTHRPDSHEPTAPDGELTRLEGEGKTAVVVRDGGKIIGIIAVADAVREGAQRVIEELHGLGIDELVLLTGDNERTAAAVARSVGLSEWRSELLPADKTAAVAALRTGRGATAMVGDGINDAPALATADVGIAMGAAGTDVALETASVALMADDLAKLSAAIRLARRALANIRQNIALSLAAIAVLVVGALAGWLTLTSGLLLNEGTALLIIANGLRLLRPPAASASVIPRVAMLHRGGGSAGS